MLTEESGNRLLRAGFTMWEVGQYAEAPSFVDLDNEVWQAAMRERLELRRGLMENDDVVEFLMEAKGGFTVTRRDFDRFIESYYRRDIINDPFDWLKRTYKPSLRSAARVDSMGAQRQYEEALSRTRPLRRLARRW